MKTSVILSSTLVLVGLLGSLAPEALAKPGGKGGDKGGGGSTPTAPLTCASGSVTSNPLAGGSSLSYSACLNPVSGNDVTSTISTDLTAFLNETLGADGWLLDSKYEGGAPAGDKGFSWVQTGKGTGTWSLTEAITTPFVISLKAGNGYAAYYIDGNTSTLGGTWATFDQKDLSHASIFVAKGGLAPEEPNATVPEPASTAALVLVGLSAVGLVRKKQG
ncbi:MAG TPA: PEP-CTERM sorting domain-containing protein [Nodosilinea sp.]|nr:PEP-CTERM sorting domain-containing protein [Nodosilinea sp.]